MSVTLTNSYMTVKAQDRLEVTLERSFYQPTSIFTEWWDRAPGFLQYCNLVSPSPVGADKVAVVDVQINQAGAGKTYGDIAQDLVGWGSLWGPDCIDMQPLTQSDLRSDVAPMRLTSVEKKAADRIAADNPFKKIGDTLGAYTKGTLWVVGLLAVAVILFYVAPFLRKPKAR